MAKAQPQPQTVLEKLPCKLSQAEKDERGHAIVQCMREKVRLEAEKAEATADFRKLIKANDKRAAELAVEWDSGTEWRMIECERRLDFNANLVLTVRTDDGTVLRSRAMHAEERQQMIAFPENDNAGPGDDAQEDREDDGDDDNDDPFDGDESDAPAASAH